MKYCFILLFYITFISSCKNGATQVGENTFVYENVVYRIVDNELTKIGDLSSKDTAKPVPKNLNVPIA